MYIKEQMYRGKLTQILYPDEGYLLQHKETKLIYGSVSLEDGRKQEDYMEVVALDILHNLHKRKQEDYIEVKEEE